MTAPTTAQAYAIEIMPRPTPDLPHRAIVSIHYDGEPLAWAVFAGPDDATAYLNPADTDPGSISAAAGHYLTHTANRTT